MTWLQVDLILVLAIAIAVIMPWSLFFPDAGPRSIVERGQPMRSSTSVPRRPDRTAGSWPMPQGEESLYRRSRGPDRARAIERARRELGTTLDALAVSPWTTIAELMDTGRCGSVTLEEPHVVAIADALLADSSLEPAETFLQWASRRHPESPALDALLHELLRRAAPFHRALPDGLFEDSLGPDRR